MSMEPERHVYVIPGGVGQVESGDTGPTITSGAFSLSLTWHQVHPLVDTLLQAMTNDCTWFRDRLQHAMEEKTPSLGMAQGGPQLRFTNPPLQVGQVTPRPGSADAEFAARLAGYGTHPGSIQCQTAIRDAALGALTWAEVRLICQHWEVPLAAAEMQFLNGIQRRWEEGALEDHELRSLVSGLERAKGTP